MVPGAHRQRNAIGVLLGTTALHLILIATAAVWLAPAINATRPRQHNPVLIVTLHHAAAVAPAADSAPVPQPQPQQVKNNDPLPRSLPAQRQKTRSRLPPTQKPAPRMPAHPVLPAETSQQQPIAPPDSAAIQSRVPDTTPAVVPEVAPSPAAKTGVAVPAAYAARNRKPDYPLLSRRYNEQGTVVLRVLVNADGTAGEVRIKKSSSYPLLDQSALAAVRDWRFVAATQDGKAISEWYEISIPYTLRN